MCNEITAMVFSKLSRRLSWVDRNVPTHLLQCTTFLPSPTYNIAVPLNVHSSSSVTLLSSLSFCIFPLSRLSAVYLKLRLSPGVSFCFCRFPAFPLYGFLAVIIPFFFLLWFPLWLAFALPFSCGYSLPLHHGVFSGLNQLLDAVDYSWYTLRLCPFQIVF